MVSLITHEEMAYLKVHDLPKGGSRPAHGVVACPDSRRRGAGTGLRARLRARWDRAKSMTENTE